MKIKKSLPPSWHFVFSHPAHLIACGFGSGLSPIASGTAGTLFAWISYPFVRAGTSDPAFALMLLGAFVLGIYVCDKTGRDLGTIDHGAIVWDEIAPFWLVLLMTPPGWLWQLAAFLLFRGFDIVKPPPASFFDRHVHNGFGVMMDDLVAAGYTLFTLAVAKSLLS